ncbi:MAG TPA: ethanolamine ammonia-lyase subunit EutB [Pyrinomonadaceae bacterium]|jgi:ethanolamine ammonia-lyase large subunit
MGRRELIETFVLAGEFKEGDLRVGGTCDARVREEARSSLCAQTLGEINRTLFVEDALSEALLRCVDSGRALAMAHLTVGQLKSILLGGEAGAWARKWCDGLSSEAIAAVVKVMTDEELARVAQSLFNSLPGEGVCVGSPAHFGSRIQPNSPGDDEQEILFSILEGLAYGCGDVVVGVNPASDEVEAIVRLEELLRRVVERLELPTRYCVLSDIVKQTSARERVPVDVGFQSLAGTSKALVGMVGMDVDGLVDLARGFPGLYFETGQGAEVTNGAAEGLDMVTLEARTYGLARLIRQHTASPWMIVNDVAGFIGPEVFRTGEQLLRACLEDSVMAKLHGLTMGLDVCSTFHMGIEPHALRHLTERIVREAAPAYLMAVAGNTDPMLGYMTTSFREHPRLRRMTRKTVSTPMQRRLTALGVMEAGGSLRADAAAMAERLYAHYMKAGGDGRSEDVLREEGARKIRELRGRGYDLGYGYEQGEFAAPPAAEARMEAIYRHAREALHATLSETVIKDVLPHHILVRTWARSREEYLSHPQTGELVCDEDGARLARLYASERRPQIQLVLSDGLNANALNENLRMIVPRLRSELSGAGFHLGETAVVIRNGRVRAGYHVGALLEVDAVIHLIGERPGTGLNTLSAYLTYGRDREGRTRWSADLDHAWTTAICGIHPKGKTAERAGGEIMRTVRRMFDERCSGVALGR